MTPLKLGHIHLKVRNLEHSIQFYQNVAGLVVTDQIGSYAFLTTDASIHHTLALQALGPHAAVPQSGSVGLYHVAFEVDSESAFGDAVKRASLHSEIVGVDHGISWAVYFNDPDGNGVEIYLDRRSSQEGLPAWSGQQSRLDLTQYL